MTGVVVCGGDIRDYDYMRKYLRQADLSICADGGAAHFKSFGSLPDVLVGDFDSISPLDLKEFISAGVETVRFPAEKDMTDSELAADIALGRGCGVIYLLGALGARMDHSLSNIFMLRKLMDAGAEGIIADERNEIRLIKDKITITREEGFRITLLPLAGKAAGVTTRGLRYPLENAVIEQGSSWGVSNEFTDEDTAEVSLTGGLLLVVKSRD